MNDDQLIAGLRRHLDSSLEDLAPEVLRGLARARAAALDAIDQPPPAWGFAGFRWALPALAVLGVGLVQLVGEPNIADPLAQTAAIDAALLSDDLPIEAYLDDGFDAWLEDSSL